MRRIATRLKGMRIDFPSSGTLGSNDLRCRKAGEKQEDYRIGISRRDQLQCLRQNKKQERKGKLFDGPREAVLLMKAAEDDGLVNAAQTDFLSFFSTNTREPTPTAR